MSDLLITNAVGVQYGMGLGFFGMAIAEGPAPMVGLVIAVNGQTLEGLETLETKVMDAATNKTSFTFRKVDIPTVIKPNDVIKLIVVDMNGGISQKTGNVTKGPGPVLIALAILN